MSNPKKDPKQCTYCSGKGWYRSYEGGDWHTSSCHKCNPISPWYKKNKAEITYRCQ
jgi:DnaJ-class molecular chaperone